MAATEPQFLTLSERVRKGRSPAQACPKGSIVSAATSDIGPSCPS